MSSGARRRAAAGLVVALFVPLLVACGGGSSPAASSTSSAGSGASSSSPTTATSTAEATPTPGVAPATFEDRCGDDKTLEQPLPKPFTFKTADGVTLLGAEFGTGPKGVLALHELGRAGLCGWASYAQQLAKSGMHVLVYDNRCVGLSTCPAGAAGGNLLADVTAARAELVERGATTTALLGASQGGGEAIAAAGTQPGWSRVVVLSGALFDLDFGGGVTAKAAMPKVSVPLVFYVATGDPDSPLAADQAIVATARPGIATLKTLPEGGHGWSLLQAFPGDAFTPVATEVTTFLSTS